MEEQNIKLPEPPHVKNIHRKLDLFAENNDIKEWDRGRIIDTFFYLYLFNKYKHNCFIKNKEPIIQNTFLGLELQIKEKKNISIEQLNIAEKHMTQIAIQLSNCIKKGLPNIIIPLYLKFANSGHANLLIYRKTNNVIEHFEPYGSQYGKNVEKIKFINKKLDDFIGILNKELPQQSQVRLVRANDVCPLFDGFQALEEKSTIPKLEIQGKGYCTAWSMFFTELSLKNPNYSSNELINIIYDKLNQLSEKDRNNYLRKVIVGYVNLINDKIEKYFSIIFGKHISIETIAKIDNKKDENFIMNVDTILDIENELLNDPYFTKDDYVQFIKRKIKNTKNNAEKQKLIKQEKMLEKIDILLNPSPISEPSKSSSEKSISSVDLSNLSSLKSSSKSSPKSSSKSSLKSSSKSSLKSSPKSSSKSSPKSSSKSSPKSSSKSSPKSSSSSAELSSLSLPSSKSSSQESNEPINLVELNTLFPSKSKSPSKKSSRSSFFKSPFKSKSPSKKSSSSIKKSVSSLKTSISSMKKSVNKLEDVSSSIKLTPKSKSSSKKSNSTLKNYVNSIKSSISSLTDSLYSLADNNSPRPSPTPKEKKSPCDEKKLKPCSEIQVRNPVTCRCRKITTGCENKKLKPCSEIQVRNSTTCRCNKINTTRKRKICQPEKFKPCTNNRVRNSVTCRCRKIKV